MTPALEPHAIATLAIAGVAFALFARERIPIETTSLGVLVLLAAGFHLFPYTRGGVTVTPADFFLGFGHEALVAICALMVLGRGLVVTGALDPASRLLGRLLEARPGAAMLLVLVLCAAASGVMNDTPIVVLMLPILVGAALRSKTSSSRTLLPMNYAVLIGGMGTTIGTSTNLLVVAIAADLGVRRFEMFDFIHVTAIAAVGGILYLWLVLPRLIPERGDAIRDDAPQMFAAVLHISEGGMAEGKTFAEVQKQAGAGLRVRRIVRGDGLELARLPSLTLRAGDRLSITAHAQDLREFADQLGATLHKPEDTEPLVDDDHPLTAEDQRLAEVVITDGSPLHRATLRTRRFGELYDVTIVGLHHAGGKALGRGEDLADVVLHAGDLLLVQGTEKDIAALRTRARLLVLDRSYDLPRTERAPLALAILAAVVLTAALKLAPISVAALAGVGAMLLTRCLDWEEATQALVGQDRPPGRLEPCPRFRAGEDRRDRVACRSLRRCERGPADRVGARAPDAAGCRIHQFRLEQRGGRGRHTDRGQHCRATPGCPGAAGARDHVRRQLLFRDADGLPDEPARHERRGLPLQRLRAWRPAAACADARELRAAPAAVLPALAGRLAESLRVARVFRRNMLQVLC